MIAIYIAGFIFLVIFVLVGYYFRDEILNAFGYNTDETTTTTTTPGVTGYTGDYVEITEADMVKDDIRNNRESGETTTYKDGNLEESNYTDPNTGEQRNITRVTKNEVEEDQSKNQEENDYYTDDLMLLKQTGLTACQKGVTYGILDDNTMYTKNGCRGIFAYKNKVGICNSEDQSSNHCSLNEVNGQNEMLAGFKERKIELIKDLGNGECEIDNVKNYGNHNSGNIFTKNGCRGYFKMGPLIGYCLHKEEISEEKTLCPIGKTDRIMINGNKKFNGIRSPPLITTGLTGECTSKDPNDPEKNNWGFVDENTMYVQRGCNAEFTWDKMKGRCFSEGINDNKKCTIGNKSDDNIKFNELWGKL